MSVCFSLATQLPGMHPFSDILISCLLVPFSLDVLHTVRMHAYRQKFGEVKSRRERVKI